MLETRSGSGKNNYERTGTVRTYGNQLAKGIQPGQDSRKRKKNVKVREKDIDSAISNYLKKGCAG